MSWSLLIIDDDALFNEFMAKLLTREGYFVATAKTAVEACSRMEELFPDIVIMDLCLPDANGYDLMLSLREEHPNTEFIIVTGSGSIRSAVECTRSGAYDYLIKPFEPEALFLSIKSILREKSLKAEIEHRRSRNNVSRTNKNTNFARYPSAAMKEVLELASFASRRDGIVQLQGESGTGKDYLAHWIHNHSQRANGPYFCINCAALPRDLAESELFGHEPGAFTGTRQRKNGLLELAENGSLLLNEIGELELQVQTKLLTFLDTKTFLRVGGTKNISINARIFTATNRDLKVEVEKGNFRRDLFYRINVFPIELPALRDRREDFTPLVEEFLHLLKEDLGLNYSPKVSPEAMKILASYDWPGNVRELRNVLERSIILADGGDISSKHLNLTTNNKEWQIVVPVTPRTGLHDITKHVARKMVLEAIQRSSTKNEAARMLGISRHALAHQIRSLGISEIS